MPNHLVYRKISIWCIPASPRNFGATIRSQKYVRIVIGLVVSALLVPPGYAQDNPPLESLRGNIVHGNIYRNRALGMTIALPGTLELQPGEGHKSAPHSDCRGPLCGNPEIDVTIATTPGSIPAYRIFLAGYKLKTSYLDRKRYPLGKLAEVMMTGSLGGSGLVPMGAQTAVHLDGKEGYRLFAGRPGENVVRAFGYVSESNGYIFLLVGSALEPTALESAIEAMALRGSVP